MRNNTFIINVIILCFLNKVNLGKSLICSIEALVRELGVGRNNENVFINKQSKFGDYYYKVGVWKRLNRI